MTNSYVFLVNWFMLVSCVVMATAGYFLIDIRIALFIVGFDSISYLVILLFAPIVLRRMHPELPVERKGAWFAGVAGSAAALAAVALAYSYGISS